MIGAVAFVVGVAALQVQAALPPPAPLFALTVAVLTLAGLLLRRSLTSVPFAHPVLAGAGGERCSAGQRITHDGLELRVMHPTVEDYVSPRSTNAMSCVVELRFGATRLLLTGDIPAAEEAAILAREPRLAVDWLAAPHHGSRSSSTDALLAAARPRWVAVQAGYRNRFGHPDATVIANAIAATESRSSAPITPAHCNSAWAHRASHL